jgi:WD40 repeat protein
VGADGGIRLCVAGADGSIRVWDPETGEPVDDPVSGTAVGKAAVTTWIAPDGTNRLAFLDDLGSLFIWNVGDGAVVGQLDTGHAAGLFALTSWTLPDGSRRLACAGDDHVVRVWNPETGAAIGEPLVGHSASVHGLITWTTADGDHRLVSAADDGSLRFWDPETGASVGTPVSGHTSWIPSLTSWMAGDGGARLASARDGGPIRVWDPDTGAECGELPTGLTRLVLTLTAWTNNDGHRRLAYGGDDRTIGVQDPDSGTYVGRVITGHTGCVRVLTNWIADDGQTRLASGSFDGTVRVWNPETGDPIGDPLTGHTGPVAALVPWRDDNGNSRLASAGWDRVIRVWDPETGTQVGHPLTGHRGNVIALTAWTGANGRAWLASTGEDGTVRLWDPQTGHALRTIEVGPISMWGLSDAPAMRDVLDREVLAQAIADQIFRPNTDADTGPAVVSVEGPWGCGKSTLMNLVRQRIPNPELTEPTPTARRLTVRAALRLARSGANTPSVAASPPGGRRGAVTAWFNPWAHQSGEQVWAGLAHEIIEAAAPVLYPHEKRREQYWLRRNLGRIDRHAMRRLLQRRIISPLLGVALAAVAAPLAIAFAELNQPLNVLGYPITAAIVALGIPIAFLVAGLIHTILRYWYAPAAHYLPAEVLCRPILDNLPIAGDGPHVDSATDPLRQARAGSLYLHQHDIGQLITDLAGAGYDLIVFIDDIDRCRTNTTGEVVEAVNLFLSGLTSTTNLRARFVIGLDPVVVAAHLDTIHADLNRHALGRSDDPSPGWAFLRKLIQLPIIVPQVPDEGLRRFAAQTTAAGIRLEVPQQTMALTAARPAPAGPPPPSPSTAPETLTGGAPIWPSYSGLPSPIITTVAWRSVEQHPDVQDFIQQRLSALPERSIREAKRMINVWQLYQRVLTTTQPLSDPKAAITRARNLVLLAEIITRWPALQRPLHQRIHQSTGLCHLAATADNDQEWRRTIRLLGIPRVHHKHALTHLRDLLQHHDGTAIATLATYLL